MNRMYRNQPYGNGTGCPRQNQGPSMAGRQVRFSCVPGNSDNNSCSCNHPAAGRNYAGMDGQSPAGNVRSSEAGSDSAGTAGAAAFSVKNSEIPNGNQGQLLSYIDEVSFGVCEAMLYLDTHPEDENARLYFESCSRKRSEAMAVYAQQYGPLTSAEAARIENGSIDWVEQPWPWEGGTC